jgi:Fe-S-cluster containining protein
MSRREAADGRPKTNAFLEQYAEAAFRIEAEFQRNLHLHGARIHCRRGCSQCCFHLFQITEIEAAAISQAVRRMPEMERAELQARARDYLPRRAEIVRRHGMVEAWGHLPPEGCRLACPALSPEGACRIYNCRPLICRKFGMPLYSPQKPGRVFACELNFAAGDQIEDDQLVQIQTGIYDYWKSTQDAYNKAGGRRDDLPITVARALLENFEPYLP